MRKIILTLELTLLCCIAKSQTPYYYYYKGEKQYLSLDTEHAFLSVKEQYVPDSISQRIISATELRPDNQNLSRKVATRYYTELKFEEKMSEKQYLDLLADIKRQNSDAIVSPYFKFGDGYAVGLSNFFYIKLKEIGDTALFIQTAEQMGYIVIKQDPYMPLWFTMSTTEASELNAMEAANFFYETDLVQAAEPDLMVECELACVNDPYFPNQWGLKNTGQFGIGIPGIDIKACDSWTITKGAGVTVAVFDAGVELDHPDLAANIDTSFDCATWLPQDTIYDPHGTACAGIIGALQNNNMGISGIAPECRLMAITKSFSGSGNAIQNYVDGFTWAWKNGADVISCSWAIPPFTTTGNQYIEDAIDSCVIRGRGGKGAVIVFGSGNDNDSNVYFPSSLPTTISVGAVSPCGERKSPASCDTEIGWGSNYGTNLDIMAPGVLISTLDMQGNKGYNPDIPIHPDTSQYGKKGTILNYGDDYTDLDYTIWFSGTSSACPAVAAVACLVISVNPCLTGQEVRDIIESTAQKVRTDLYSYDTVAGRTNGTWNMEMGYGLVDAYAAVLAAQNTLSRLDLLIRDYANDNGTVPSNPTPNTWSSPDIWCRHAQDGDSIHQEPIPNHTTFLYTRIKNRGYAPSQGNEVLKLYYAKEGTSLTWDSCWNGNTFSNGAPMGDFIDSVVLPVISCGKDTIVCIPWEVPNPNDYYGISGIGSNIFGFRLLATIESAIDTTTFSNTKNIDTLVRFNNHIAMKGVNLSNRNLLIQNTLTDDGTEPDNSPVVCNSPSIWIKNSSSAWDTIPEANKPNTVNIRVKNTGQTPSLGGDTLKLFWAKTEDTIKWQQDFTFFNFAILPVIQPNQEAIVQATWTAPAPANYSNSSNRYKFSLLARIEEKGGFIFESEDLDSLVRNNRCIGLKEVLVGDMFDLYICDDALDTGVEPYSPAVMWNSPDIWIRRGQDGYSIDTHQEPEPNEFCCIYARIKNRGNKTYYPSDNAVVSFYWAKANPNSGQYLKWDSCWTGKKTYPQGQLTGGFIGSRAIYVVPPGEEDIEHFCWYPTPETDIYSGIGDSTQFYILAVIEGHEVNIYPDVETLIKNNNNVAGRSIHIQEYIRPSKEVDLYIKDNYEDIGDEPNFTAGSNFWHSPDIWVRHNDDGDINHQEPQGGAINILHVRVKNIGYGTSRGDEQLYTYWAKAGSSLSWDYSWVGNPFPQGGPLMGDFIDSQPIPSLASGQETVVKFPWNVPDTTGYTGYGDNTEVSHFCLLARIIAENDPMASQELCGMAYNIVQNNNIAQRNVTIIGGAGGNISGVICVGNLYDWIHAFCLKFNCESNSSTLWQEAELTVKLNTTLYAAWERGGFQGENIEQIGDKLILIRGANAKLCNLIFEPREMGFLDMRFNFLTREITNQTNYTFHIIQTDEGTNEVIGGEVYEVHKSPRNLFYASANDVYAFQGDPITLSANNVGEPAAYNWYDENGNLVHIGRIFSTNADHEQKYKLEVIASADGYKDYADVWVKIVPGKIESIQPNPATNHVIVTCVFNNVSEAYLTISSQTGVVFATHFLNTSPQSVVCDIAAYTPSRYTVTLFCDGVAVDSKTFVKQ